MAAQSRRRRLAGCRTDDVGGDALVPGGGPDTATAYSPGGQPGDLGFKMKAIYDALGRGANRSFKELDITFSQLSLLSNLMVQGGQTTQRHLEQLMGVSHPTVVGLVQRLEAKGYVTSFFSVEDARMKIVAITDLGGAVAGRADGHRRLSERAMVRGLSDDEVAQLKSMLDRVYANIVAMEGSASPGEGR